MRRHADAHRGLQTTVVGLSGEVKTSASIVRRTFARRVCKYYESLGDETELLGLFWRPYVSIPGPSPMRALSKSWRVTEYATWPCLMTGMFNKCFSFMSRIASPIVVDSSAT